MDGVPPVVFAGAFAVAAGIPLFVWSMLAARPGRERDGGDQRAARLDESATQRLLKPAVRAAARRARRMTPAGWVESLERKVRLAGPESGWTADRALAAKLGLGTLGLVAGVLAGGSFPLGGPVVGTVALTAFGYLTPDAILWGRAKERQELIGRALPDVLDQLTICVESGLGFDAAMKRVGAGAHGPLAEELRRTLNEIAVGVPRAEALAALAERTDVPELRHFVLAVRQADAFGLPIARVLRIQASQLRVKRRQAAEERALKMPVKIVFPLVTCIFPALFVVLLGPAVVRVLRAFG